MNYEKIGKFIQIKRKEKNLTQKDLASKLNVTDKAISKWERGLGCPDVSLLENLSNILDISILEILKGKDLELNNNSVNEYILDTINYSKVEINKRYKSILLNVLSFIIIFIIGILILLNFYHINYLNKEYIYDFNNSQIKNININLKEIQENINIIKNSNFKYTKQENGQLLDLIESSYKVLSNNPILDYIGKINLTINDLYIIDNYYYDESNIYFGYNILGKYENKMNDYMNYYKTILLVKGYNGISLYQEVNDIYKYNINYNNYFINNNKVDARIYSFSYSVEELLIFTNNVIEVGEAYE